MNINFSSKKITHHSFFWFSKMFWIFFQRIFRTNNIIVSEQSRIDARCWYGWWWWWWEHVFFECRQRQQQQMSINIIIIIPVKFRFLFFLFSLVWNSLCDMLAVLFCFLCSILVFWLKSAKMNEWMNEWS